jgi:hypothetical protein
VPREMYLDGPRVRFCEDVGDVARGRLYAMIRMGPWVGERCCCVATQIW